MAPLIMDVNVSVGTIFSIIKAPEGVENPTAADFMQPGTMVAEIHRILTRGGIFIYPMDSKMKAAGKTGKLRLLYEANPMGFIVEQAGGMATTAYSRIMELQPTDLHQRVPVVMGSRNEVELVTGYHNV
ncbi:hypothetical protein [Thiothrix winogradskyi]|uniref:Fructose-1-6-bisphosphatase class 1 C-terminal domain-containing protein n=1 Tax=Thiothrix winogradskyi TaxID=96472 RepID=A0ABY3T043_9GAMM|nr:hypothetical protein [Thiothrix winogradskyi]UJS25157.1 hypothetical protein L2Y54_03730 [Thiothrix winogradskyi]